MRIGLRQDDWKVSGQIGDGGIKARKYERSELTFLIRGIALKNEPDRWQAAWAEAMTDVHLTTKSGQHTIEEWIKALE